MKIEIIPILKDNYSYLLIGQDGTTGIVDPGEVVPILDYLRRNALDLDFIFNTHHHADHIAGNAELINATEAKLIGPLAEKHRIPNMDIMLRDGDIFHFGGHPIHVFETPGHTTGHTCFYAPNDNALFTGDTLFSMGTGRLFEGSAEDMFGSLAKIKSLPDDTLIYCGHEYTYNNGRFCLSINPNNQALQQRMADIETLRVQDLPTLPVSLRVEKETNPFLQAKEPEELAKLREQKEAF